MTSQGLLEVISSQIGNFQQRTMSITATIEAPKGTAQSLGASTFYGFDKRIKKLRICIYYKVFVCFKLANG
jgi:hypothetical protein